MQDIRYFSGIFSDIQIAAVFEQETVAAEKFGLCQTICEASRSCYAGEYAGCHLCVTVESLQTNMLCLQMELYSDRPLYCRQLELHCTYERPGQDLSRCYVPGGALHCGLAGLHRLADWPHTPEDIRFCGLFSGAQEPCVLFGTQIPCSWMVLYHAELLRQDCVRFTARNCFTGSAAEKRRLKTERLLLITGLCPTEAVTRYGQTIPALPAQAFARPMIGWSTWDYYFNDYCTDDLLENIWQLKGDGQLSERVKYFFLDDGWQYREGEWHVNYRFPQGLKAIADEIRAQGFEPGIWTNGCQVYPLTRAGLHCGQMFLKDARGNAIESEGRYIIDPTHPAGEAYLSGLYRQLYDDGFRVFKVDFVSQLQLAVSFHDPVGPYEAIRRLFAVIRRAVGVESILLGCSYPPECGAGCVEYNRFAVDIHNHWTHVLWILEYLQMNFWQNGRLYRLDPDFLIVRGSDTSREEETNVYNPAPNLPFVPDAPGNRWRRGPVFSYHEAQTWANLVVFTAGNIVLGDRLGMLNEAGMQLVRTHLQPNRQTAVPLDLGSGPWAGIWYSAEDRKLLVINVQDEPGTYCVRFGAYGICPPEKLFCEKPFRYRQGCIYAALDAHESAVFSW